MQLQVLSNTCETCSLQTINSPKLGAKQTYFNPFGCPGGNVQGIQVKPLILDVCVISCI